MNIGGTLRYEQLAQLHRPKDTSQLREEVRRLAHTLTAQDISTALRIDLVQVREMLAATGSEAADIHADHASISRARSEHGRGNQ
jgi:hypothetical protein